jgi:hypothetical protein
MIVAPSLEIVVTPLSSCTSLSRPRGPCGSRERDVRGTIAADGGRHLRWRAISQRGGAGVDAPASCGWSPRPPCTR